MCRIDFGQFNEQRQHHAASFTIAFLIYIWKLYLMDPNDLSMNTAPPKPRQHMMPPCTAPTAIFAALSVPGCLVVVPVVCKPHCTAPPHNKNHLIIADPILESIACRRDVRAFCKHALINHSLSSSLFILQSRDTAGTIQQPRGTNPH